MKWMELIGETPFVPQRACLVSAGTEKRAIKTTVEMKVSCTLLYSLSSNEKDFYLIG